MELTNIASPGGGEGEDKTWMMSPKGCETKLSELSQKSPLLHTWSDNLKERVQDLVPQSNEIEKELEAKFRM